MHHDCRTTRTSGDREEGEIYCGQCAKRRVAGNRTVHAGLIEEMIEINNEMTEDDGALPRSIGGASSKESDTLTVGSRKLIRTNNASQEKSGQKKRDTQGNKSLRGMKTRRSCKKKGN